MWIYENWDGEGREERVDENTARRPEADSVWQLSILTGLPLWRKGSHPTTMMSTDACHQGQCLLQKGGGCWKFSLHRAEDYGPWQRSGSWEAWVHLPPDLPPPRHPAFLQKSHPGRFVLGPGEPLPAFFKSNCILNTCLYHSFKSLRNSTECIRTVYTPDAIHF